MAFKSLSRVSKSLQDHLRVFESFQEPSTLLQTNSLRKGIERFIENARVSRMIMLQIEYRGLGPLIKQNSPFVFPLLHYDDSRKDHNRHASCIGKKVFLNFKRAKPQQQQLSRVQYCFSIDYGKIQGYLQYVNALDVNILPNVGKKSRFSFSFYTWVDTQLLFTSQFHCLRQSFPDRMTNFQMTKYRILNFSLEVQKCMVSSMATPSNLLKKLGHENKVFSDVIAHC